VVDAGEIGVGQFKFATRVQIMLVEFLLVQYSDATSNWCERLGYWTGDRGRYCLVHSSYAGCNNNMGMQVSWQDIKKACNTLSRLGILI
jgi:hypothetical protein